MRRVKLAVALGLLLAVVCLQPCLTAPVAALVPDLAVLVRFEGYLKLIEPGRWLVGDSFVTVDDQTIIIEKRGAAEVGAWVSVDGEKDDQGAITAQVITVQRAASRGGPFIQFSGILRKQLDNLWVIDETIVAVNESTVVSSDLGPGWLVWVVAEQMAGSLDPVALYIQGLASRPDELSVEFEGVLTSMGPHWSVDERPFILPPDAAIMGDPAPGARVELKARITPDKSVVVQLLRVVDTSADARLSALVAGITTMPNGEQVWDIIAFPDVSSGEPVAGTLHVGENSMVDESRAVARPGMYAEVQGLTVGRDEYAADVVRMEEPFPTTATGILEPAGKTAGGGWWSVGGQRVWMEPVEGSQADALTDEWVVVRGLRLGNGVILAQKVAAAPSQAK